MIVWVHVLVMVMEFIMRFYNPIHAYVTVGRKIKTIDSPRVINKFFC